MVWEEADFTHLGERDLASLCTAHGTIISGRQAGEKSPVTK